MQVLTAYHRSVPREEKCVEYGLSKDDVEAACDQVSRLWLCYFQLFIPDAEGPVGPMDVAISGSTQLSRAFCSSIETGFPDPRGAAMPLEPQRSAARGEVQLDRLLSIPVINITTGGSESPPRRTQAV